jgi:hypothetical protein
MIRMFAWVYKNITFFAYSSTVHSTVHCRKELIYTKMYGDVKVKKKIYYLSVKFLQILKIYCSARKEGVNTGMNQTISTLYKITKSIQPGTERGI